MLETRYSAGLAIIYQGQILLGRSTGRKDKKSFGIPKGGIEEGESKLDAAIRETHEELGIKVDRKLINNNEYTFALTSKRFKYNKVVYYFIVEIDDLSQIGLSGLKVPKRQLDTKEISEARFFNFKDARQSIMISQTSMLENVASKGLLESKTIAGLEVEPNQEDNPTQNVEEDQRLNKIRRYKGKIKDFESYWNDRITKGNN